MKKRLLSLAMALAMILSLSPVAAFAAEGGAGSITMNPTAIGGVNYYYADATGATEDTDFVFTVSGRGGSTNYSFKKSQLTQVADTNYYYVLVPGTTALSGTLYGFTGGEATTYKNVYNTLGASADDSYDVISSATHYSGHHAKDIPSLVTYGTDGEGQKAITGLNLNRQKTTVNADVYVAASILNAAGATLSNEQKEALKVTLKTNPMSAPSATTVPVRLSSASYASSRYGVGEFAIVPDATVEGYNWSEYWGSVYAATVNDGTTTVGAVHWIDLYGEAATAGPHYNKVELALNNGESVASNKAEVNRYAAFFDQTEGKLKAGTYTVTIYAEGYEPLTGSVTVGPTLKNKNAAYNGKPVAIDAAEGVTDEITYTYYADKACTKKIGVPVNAGVYYAKASTADFVSAPATITIRKVKNTITKYKSSKTLKAKTLKSKKQKIKLAPKAKENASVSCKLKSVSKKKLKKFISVSKNGIVTVKQGAPKGKYTIKITMTTKATKNYSQTPVVKPLKLTIK